jgi:hypothetical protein
MYDAVHTFTKSSQSLQGLDTALYQQPVFSSARLGTMQIVGYIVGNKIVGMEQSTVP